MRKIISRGSEIFVVMGEAEKKYCGLDSLNESMGALIHCYAGSTNALHD